MNFYLRTLLVLVIAGVVLSLLNKVYVNGHTRYYKHEMERINVLLNKEAYYDVLYIGSSRTHMHYNPRVIDSITHLSSYNLGVEGGNLLEINLWFQVYLQIHQAPKMVVLDLPVFAFDIEKRPFFNPTIYFPYLENDIIYNTLARYKKIQLFKYLPLLELMEIDDYNKFNALRGILGKKEEISYGFTYNGYADNGIRGLTPATGLPQDTITYAVAEAGKKILDAIIDSCSRRHIKLIIAYSPEYYNTDYKKRIDFFQYVTEVSKKNLIPFFDYRNLSICKDSTLFANQSHLNKFGARIYSRYVAEAIVAELPGR
ncbi:MAG: hypothetical protein ABI416_11050 [Ginsengibacter sp.]